MDVKELKELIEIFQDSELSELEIEEEGCSIRLQRNTPAPMPMIMQAPVAAGHPAPAAPAASSEPAVEEETYAEVITSPMVGTFYSAPAPGEDPFVREGDTVEDGQTVCIVEAMKLMNEVGASGHCVIEKVLAENGQPVEFGQPLFAIRHI